MAIMVLYQPMIFLPWLIFLVAGLQQAQAFGKCAFLYFRHNPKIIVSSWENAGMTIGAFVCVCGFIASR